MDQVTPFNRQGKNTTRSIKSTARARQGTGTKGKKPTRDNPQGRLVVLRPSISAPIVQRRFVVSSNVSSDGSGGITIASRGIADFISAAGTEWTNFAQEFLEFRVVSLGYWFVPATTNATSSTGPYQAGMLAGPWAQLKPTNVSSIQQSCTLVKWSTLEEKEIMIVRPTTVNANAFNPYGTAVPIDRDWGISYALAPNMAVAVTSRIFGLCEEMWVEFRTPQ